MLLLLALVCAFGLFDHSLWSGNDTREGAMIAEMVRTHTWVAPVFNGQHYLEKPPLLHWTGALLCRLFGAVNEGLVRLPAALYGFAALLVILSWARSLNRAAAGFAAAFMCATSALYFEYARIVLTDSALTGMVVFALWLFWRAYTAESFFIGRYLLFLFVAAFSFYAKGLIGPGMIWLTVMAWLLYQKRLRLLLILAAAFAPVFLLALAPWVLALWQTGGGVYLHKVFWENQFGRFLYFDDPTLPIDPYLIHKEPVYFYLLSLPLRLLPWTLLVIPALYYWFRRNSAVKEPLALFLKTAFLAMLFLLHISSAKAACYALPLFPFLFLMTGIWLEDAAQAWNSPVERKLVTITLATVLIAAVAAPAAYLPAFIFHWPAVWAQGAGAAFTGLVMAALAMGAGYVFSARIWREFKSGQRRKAVIILPAFFAVAGLLTAAAFLPAIDFHRTYQPFAQVAQAAARAGHRLAFAGAAERDLGAFMFYLNARLPVITLTNRAALAAFADQEPGPAGIIVPADKLRPALQDVQNLPFSIKQAEDAGKKSASFRLLIVNPAKGTQEESSKTQLKSAKRIHK